MSKIESFEDIDCWQKARELSGRIYELSSEENFRKDYSLRDQIRRAANSIVLNIAEGFGRKTDKEFINFLVYSHGSVSEVQAALYLAKDQDYISADVFEDLKTDYEELSKMIAGFIRYLQGSSDEQ